MTMESELIATFEKYGYMMVGKRAYAPGRWEIRIAPLPEENPYEHVLFDYDNIAAEIATENSSHE